MPRALAILALLAVLGSSSDALSAGRSGRTRTHTVYPGQTLGMIAKRYNVSIEAICTANGIKKNEPIKPKQSLLIPSRDDKDGTQARDERLGKRAEPEKKRKAKAEPEKKAKAEPEKKAKAKEKDPYVKRPPRKGYIVISGPNGTWKGYAITKEGKVTDRARDGFEKVLASWRTGKRERIHGRLIRLLTRVSDRFGGRPIRIVSGFRPFTASQYTAHSRHNIGRAVDFSVPGVPNEVVRDYCRTLGKVGVGYYPNSSFVHLDVRDVPTYWIDYSGPGQAPRYAHSKKAPEPQPAAKPEKPPEPSGSTATPTKSDGNG